MNVPLKLIVQFFCGALCFVTVYAQDAALPSIDEGLPTQTPSTSLTATPSPSPSSTPPEFLPTPRPSPATGSRTAAVRSAMAAVPGVAQLDEMFKQTSLGKDAEELRLHVQTRELENRIANDPEIVASKAAAKTAPTDLEKRERLRRYYELYYGRMHAMAGSTGLKTYIDAMKVRHLKALEQSRVRPISSPERGGLTEESEN
jgi:hypothetical protein